MEPSSEYFHTTANVVRDENGLEVAAFSSARDAEHFVACVNACRGISNPESSIPEIVSALRLAQPVIRPGAGIANHAITKALAALIPCTQQPAPKVEEPDQPQSGYRVSIEIDVDADGHVQAARRAWELLSGDDAMLPVCKVIEHDTAEAQTIDLQEDWEEQTHNGN